MAVLLAALFCFAVLTLWVDAWWPVTVFQVGVFVVAAASLLRSRKAIAFTYPMAALSLAVTFGLVQCLIGHTENSYETRMATVRWATYLAVFLAGYLLLGESHQRRRFRGAMLWFAFLTALLATVQTFTSGGRVFWMFPSGYSDFVMGPFLSQNHHAAFIEVVLPFALLGAFRNLRSSLLPAILAAAMYASVIASASRAGVVLTTLEIVVVAALVRTRSGASACLAGGALLRIAALFAVFTVVVGWEPVWTRLTAPDPMRVRQELALSSVRMIAEHPAFGVGLGAWPSAYPRYALVDLGAYVNQAHNDWLQWTAEGGLPFGLLVASLFLWCLRPAFRSIWGLGAVAVFLHALVDYPFSRPALGSWTILVLAMLAARERHAADSRPEANVSAHVRTDSGV